MADEQQKKWEPLEYTSPKFNPATFTPGKFTPAHKDKDGNVVPAKSTPATSTPATTTPGRVETAKQRKERESKSIGSTAPSTPASSAPSNAGSVKSNAKPAPSSYTGDTIPLVKKGDFGWHFMTEGLANAVITKLNILWNNRDIQKSTSDSRVIFPKQETKEPTKQVNPTGSPTESGGIKWRGYYLSTATYNTNDVVTYHHIDSIGRSIQGTYICLRNAVSGIEPPMGDNRYSDDGSGNHVWTEFSPGHWSRFIVGDVDSVDNVFPVAADCTDINRGKVTVIGEDTAKYIELDPNTNVTLAGDRINWILPMINPNSTGTITMTLYPLTVCVNGTDVTLYFLAGTNE